MFVGVNFSVMFTNFGHFHLVILIWSCEIPKLVALQKPKNKGIKHQNAYFKMSIMVFKPPKRHFSFMKWTPSDCRSSKR